MTPTIIIREVKEIKVFKEIKGSRGGLWVLGKMCTFADMLRTIDLSVGYRDGGKERRLLTGLNVHLAEGQLVALLGRNGAGKSTLLRALTGSDKPLSGRVEFRGVDVSTLTALERARLVGLVSTDRIQAGGLTVRELVGMGRQPYTGFLGRLGDEDKNRVAEGMDAVGITSKADSYLSSLSDGERQKAMIARVLVQRTPLIVLDEPTAFLDVASRIEIMGLLRRLAHEGGRSVLLSSHDVSQSLQLADRLWIITDDGQLLDGTPRELVNCGAMDRVFGSRLVRFNPTLLDYESAD